MTLAETINEISTEHVRSGGLILGQNLEAQQSVCGTVPVGEPGVVIMPTTETAGMGISIGAALSGRPVIHVIRFASFLWLQASPIVNYAAKCKEIFGYDLPLWIRVSSDDNIGPVHSGMYHSPFLHMPGDLNVIAPMTPAEYRAAWADFQQSKQPFLVSEHRRAYDYGLEMPDVKVTEADLTIIAIGPGRFDAMGARAALATLHGMSVDLFHIWNLSGWTADLANILQSVATSRKCLIIDSTFERCSFAEHVAYQLYRSLFEISQGARGQYNIQVLGLADRSPGVSVGKNATPNCQDIIDAALAL